MTGLPTTERFGGASRLLRQTALVRYGFAIATVALAVVIRIVLIPFVGRGTPISLFLSSTLVTGLLVGTGPALLTLVISVIVAVFFFVMPSGEIIYRTDLQLLLYTADGALVVYITHRLNAGTLRLEEANEELSLANEQRLSALERTQETIDLAPDAYFLADLGGRFTAVNREACRLLGYEREELMRLTAFDIVPESDAGRLDETRAELLKPGTTHTAEWMMKRKDGSLVPVEVSANIIRHSRWQAFARDITERKRSEAEAEAANARLRESEERFRLTIDDAPIGMALVALDGRFVRVNHRLCEITGYAADELTKLTYQDITHPDDLAKDVQLATRLAAGELPRYQLEKRYIRKDRSVVDIMLSVSVLSGPDHHPRYFISQIEDITERKRAESALRSSEAKFSGIVSIAADAIISVDENQHITIFNEGAESIFGYSKEEMLGVPLERLIPERFREAHRAHIARFANEEQSARRMADRQDIFGLRKNGEEFPAEASISRVSAGGSQFFSVVLRDITYQKSVQQALERAIKARDEVLGFVAHDLRNPLNTIIMQASILERPEPEPERRDMTPRDVIQRSARRLNRMIQDLLDVASIEAGQLKVESVAVDAMELVRDAVESQKPAASESKLELHAEVPPDVPKVCGDRDRLMQVFENLIGNAIKFTPEGGRIVVAAAKHDDDVVFSVADTGNGMPPEHLKHVFDRFWQAATRAKRLGAGLGLPITKGIVEAHGGRIWVESREGAGTTFFFTIPAVSAETRYPAPATTKKRPVHRRASRRSPR